MADNDKSKAQPKPTDPLMQVAALVAYNQHKRISDDQLRSMGYTVDSETPGWKINQELIVLEARKAYSLMSSGSVRWIAGSAFSGVPRKDQPGLNDVKVLPHVLVVGGEPMPNGRSRVHFRSKPNPNARGAKDGSEHAQTEFMNTAAGQVTVAQARAAKGKIVTAIVEMEPMSGRQGEFVRTLRDLTFVRDMTREDMTRLEVDDQWLNERGITPPSA